MRIIDVFLASSNELKPERDAFEIFISRHGNTWIDTRQTMLRLRIWEDFIDAVSPTRSQDEYNKAIDGCSIFVMLFWTKVGRYTNEEFDVAHAKFKATGLPLVYTYFKSVPGPGPAEPSLQVFDKKLQDIGHFKTVFKSNEDLLLHFAMQLEKVYHIVTAQQQGVVSNKKADLLLMTSKLQFPEVINELVQKFGNDNIQLNVLIQEFISPPNNFNPVQFGSRLKVFININY